MFHGLLFLTDFAHDLEASCVLAVILHSNSLQTTDRAQIHIQEEWRLLSPPSNRFDARHTKKTNTHNCIFRTTCHEPNYYQIKADRSKNKQQEEFYPSQAFEVEFVVGDGQSTANSPREGANIHDVFG